MTNRPPGAGRSNQGTVKGGTMTNRPPGAGTTITKRNH